MHARHLVKEEKTHPGGLPMNDRLETGGLSESQEEAGLSEE